MADQHQCHDHRLRRRRPDIALHGQVVVNLHAGHTGACGTAGEQEDVVELVECPDRAQHREQADDRHELRQHDEPERLPGRGTVDKRSLLRLVRHGREPRHEEKEREWEVAPSFEGDHCQQRGRYRDLQPEHIPGSHRLR